MVNADKHGQWRHLCGALLRWSNYEQQMAATCNATLLRSQVEKRCCDLKLSRNKISLLQVEAACCRKSNWRLLFSTNFFNLQQQNLIRCVTMFEVGCNTCNNALQLAMLRCKLTKTVPRITGLSIHTGDTALVSHRIYAVLKTYKCSQWRCLQNEDVVG